MKKPTTVSEVEARLDYFRQRAKREHPLICEGHVVREYHTEKFNVIGSYTINPKTLKITVKGSICFGQFPDTELGLEFEKVTGSIGIEDCPNLNTLKGFPKSAWRINIEQCPNLRSLDHISINAI